MSRHTPGPWVVDLDVIADSNDIETAVEIATVGPSTRSHLERQANLRLISAAPLLLERVRYRYEACDCMDPADQGEMSSEEFFDQHACADCHGDRAAIAKAEGNG